MNSVVIKRVRHFVYDDIKEFEEANPNIVVQKDWKLAKVDDWVIADDGGVCQILRRKDGIDHPRDSKFYRYAQGYVGTAVGTYLLRSGKVMDTAFENGKPVRKNRYSFSGNVPQRIKNRTKPTKKETIFTAKVIRGDDPIDAVLTTYEIEEHNQVKKARRKAVTLLKQERIMTEIEKSVKDIAKGLGIDHEYVMRRMKLLGDTSEDEQVSLRAIIKLGEYIGTDGIKTKTTATFGLLGEIKPGFSLEQLESAERKELPEHEKEIKEEVIDE